jgi:hypothetical protein
MKTSLWSRPRPVALVALVLSLAVLPLQSGCVAVVAAGAAGTGVAWYNGRLESTLGGDYNRVLNATRAALSQLEFAKVSENKDALKAVFISRTAQDKKVEITLSKLTETTTKVEIRIGFFGDEPMSITVLEKIKGNL